MKYNVIQRLPGNKAQIGHNRCCGLIKYIKVLLCIFFFVVASTSRTIGQAKDLTTETKQAMMNATKFMVEKISVSAGQTYDNIMLLIQFYKYTGQRKFLSRIPDAIQWLEHSQLPDSETEGGKYTHPVFIEIGTDKAIYAHRKGTGVSDGIYWVD
jgi:hypothetical protein